MALDGQGLARPERPGPLVLDADYDPEVLRHVSVLKLAEEEAVTIVGETDEDALRSLDVPEVVVTLYIERGLWDRFLADAVAQDFRPALLQAELNLCSTGDVAQDFHPALLWRATSAP